MQGPAGRGRLRRVGHQHARVPARLGVDPDDRLAVEVLGHVGDEAVLAEHDVRRGDAVVQRTGRGVAQACGEDRHDGDQGDAHGDDQE